MTDLLDMSTMSVGNILYIEKKTTRTTKNSPFKIGPENSAGRRVVDIAFTVFGNVVFANHTSLYIDTF